MASPLTSDELRSFLRSDYPRVLGAVTLLTGSRATAEDAVSEALARAWEHSRRPRADPIERLDRWVLTVALNLARNRWRKLRREVMRRDVERPAEDPPDPSLVDLRRSLRDLPARQREVVVLHYLLDLPVAEIAELLELSPGGVKHALFRARRSLADALTIKEVPT